MMAMNTTMSLREAVYTFAMQLPPEERLAVGEDIIQSVNDKASETPKDDLNESWGERVAQLIESLDTSGWNEPQFEDAVAWVRSVREDMSSRFPEGWADEENS